MSTNSGGGTYGLISSSLGGGGGGLSTSLGLSICAISTGGISVCFSLPARPEKKPQMKNMGSAMAASKAAPLRPENSDGVSYLYISLFDLNPYPLVVSAARATATR